MVAEQDLYCNSENQVVELNTCSSVWIYESKSKNKFTWCKITTKEPQKHSPNIVPMDYHLFPALEENVGGPNLKMSVRYKQL
jgi:hypothetical protein